MIDFTKTDDGNLMLTLTDEGRKHIEENPERDHETLFLDLIEHHLCNGWDLIRPEEVGALTEATIIADDVVELGAVIAGTAPGRTSADDITVADLTGVAVQDIEIARTVLEAVVGGVRR